MSAQTDTVERVFALFNELPGDQEARRDHPALAELMALMDPDVLFVAPAGRPDASWSGAIVQIQAFFDHESARREFDGV
jgi:hypothetical protein